MPVCCKAEEFENWCEDEDTFEYNGQYYCKFHLPCGTQHKPDAPLFNEFIFERIDQALKQRKHCNLAGTQFPGDIRFSSYYRDNPLPNIDFSSTLFRGSAEFSLAHFAGDADFKYSSFESTAKFFKSYFNGTVCFKSINLKTFSTFRLCTFIGEVDFRRAHFRGNADFRFVKFMDVVEFGSTIFERDASFYRVMFEKKVQFNSTIFKRLASFNEAQFNSSANFTLAIIQKVARFKKAIFGETAYFNLVNFEGAVDFRSAVFINDAFFKEAVFNREAYFVSVDFQMASYFRIASFEGILDFTETKIQTAVFNRSQFKKPVYFRRCFLGQAQFSDSQVVEVLEFDQADLTRSEFGGAPLEKFRFIDCSWPLHNGRNTLYEARRVVSIHGIRGFVKLNTPNIVGIHTSDTPTTEEIPLGIKIPPKVFLQRPEAGKLQDIFRRLKKIAKLEHDESLAGDWHFWEKEMQRLASGPASSALLWIYKQLSGYGESWQRAGIVLFAALVFPILVSPLVDWLPGVWPEDLSPGWGVLEEINKWWAGKWSDWLPFVKQTDAERGIMGNFMIGAYRILVTGQAALFLLALRNKMRR